MNKKTLYVHQSAHKCITIFLNKFALDNSFLEITDHGSFRSDFHQNWNVISTEKFQQISKLRYSALFFHLPEKGVIFKLNYSLLQNVSQFWLLHNKFSFSFFARLLIHKLGIKKINENQWYSQRDIEFFFGNSFYQKKSCLLPPELFDLIPFDFLRKQIAKINLYLDSISSIQMLPRIFFRNTVLVKPADNIANEISIILTNFNKGIEIIGAVNSVIQQSKMNWRLIIVDDGSTDISKYYLERLKHLRHPKIQVVINSQNRGVSYSRNVGIQQANQWHIFLDADDQLDTRAIENINLVQFVFGEKPIIKFGVKYRSVSGIPSVINLSRVSLYNFLFNPFLWKESITLENTKQIKMNSVFFDTEIIRESERHLRLFKQFPVYFCNLKIRYWNLNNVTYSLHQTHDKNVVNQKIMGIRKILQNGSFLEKYSLFFLYQRLVLVYFMLSYIQTWSKK